MCKRWTLSKLIIICIIEKRSKLKYGKWVHIFHLELWIKKLWPKERSRVKLSIWLLTTLKIKKNKGQMTSNNNMKCNVGNISFNITTIVGSSSIAFHMKKLWTSKILGGKNHFNVILIKISNYRDNSGGLLPSWGCVNVITPSHIYDPKYIIGRMVVAFFKFEPCQCNNSKPSLWAKINSICIDHLHCLACVGDLCVRCLWSSYYPCPISQFPHAPFMPPKCTKLRKCTLGCISLQLWESIRYLPLKPFDKHWGMPINEK